jgi:hypothetical protein
MGKNDPQKRKSSEISCFEVLDVLLNFFPALYLFEYLVIKTLDPDRYRIS